MSLDAGLETRASAFVETPMQARPGRLVAVCEPSAEAAAAPRRVAYVMSRFPKITETFVLYEILALERLGHRVEIFPLMRARGPVRHAEAERLVKRARFRAFLSWPVFTAHIYYLFHRPGAYLRTLVEVIRGTWRSTNFFLGALAFFPKAVRFARDVERLEIRHVHAHFANHPALVALIVHRLTGVPFSFTVHAFDLFVDRTMLAKKVEAASFVVAISDYNRRLMTETCGEAAADKIQVIHCGVDPSLFAPESRPPGDAFRILCVASLEEMKGHRILIEACRLLREHGLGFHCECIGSGSLESELRRQIASARLERHVTLAGPRPRAEVIRALARADAVALASMPTRAGKQEGIPVALMEAMAAGLPVVATEISGVPELIEDGRTGYLVPPGDAKTLADRLTRLAGNAKLARAMGAAGRARVQREFNQEQSAAELSRLFGR